MDRGEILSAIQSWPAAHDGKAPGRETFLDAYGLKEHDVVGKYWVKWSDAVAEAGLKPLALNAALAKDDLARSYLGLVRKLGHFPTNAELRFEHQGDLSFPSVNTFHTRFGNKAATVRILREYCLNHPGFDDALGLLPVLLDRSTVDEANTPGDSALGYVYLLKSGKHYKIGRANDAGRRLYEVRLQMPESVEEVWKIKTDDPEGVELYWHRRFRHLRKNGEWFALGRKEVEAFKRWKRID